MASTFSGAFEKQQRITNYLSRRLHHSRFRWAKLFPSNPANLTPSHFHADVDNKGWTVVVSILADGSVIGGFTSVSWTSNTVDLSDSLAFLFSLPDKGVEVFFPAAPGQPVQVSHNPANGPCFGNNELYLSLAPNHAGSVCGQLVNYSVEAPTANGVGVVADPQNPATPWDPTTGLKHVVAVEVYQLIPADYSLSLNVNPLDNKKALAALASEFKKLRNLGLTQLNLCFVGDSKAGKSTTINNLLSVFSSAQRLQTPAYSTNLDVPGTTAYLQYNLDLIGDLIDGFTPLPVYCSDTQGFTGMNIDKVDTLIPFIAQGRVPVNWEADNNPAFLPNNTVSADNWIHLFVIVIPAEAITNPTKMKEYQRIERTIRTRPPNSTSHPKYPTVVYLVTKMDDPTYGGDVLLAQHPTRADASEIWATYKKMLKEPTGLGNSDAFPIVNVTEQFTEIKDGHLSVLFEAWLRILCAVRTNVAQWK